MEIKKWEIVVGIIGVVSGLLAIIDYATQFGEWLSTTFGISIMVDFILVFYVVGVLLFPAYLIISYLRQKETHLDPRFIHLEIHYSQRKDDPETPEPSRPYFVENKDTKQAYWVGDLINPYVKMKKIRWVSHDDERTLKKHFKENEIIAHNTTPMPEDLGLIFKKGSLIRQIAEPSIVTKLKGHRLSDLEIMDIFPFYYILPFFSVKDKHTFRLLIKHSTKETYHVPPHDLELMEYGIIPHNSSMFRYPIFDSYRKWSKRNGYTYHPQYFSEEQLLEVLHEQNSKK